MSALDRILDALRDRDRRPRPGTGGQWLARCPAHDDQSPSLSVRQVEGHALIFCQAGCAAAEVMTALDLTLRDLYDDPRGATYTYPDGRIVHRSPDKRFYQSGNTNGTALYRLDKVTAAVAAEQTVYICEGEKDVHALEAIGLTATTSPMGAGKWAKIDPTPLAGGTVVIVADDDEPGRRHAAEVRDSLIGLGATVNIVTAKVGKDAADHVAAGYDAADFVPLQLLVDDFAEPPLPLTPTCCATRFPTEVLPGWARAMVEAEAEATQTDAGMAASVLLGALAAAAGGHARVWIRAGWSEPVNIFTVSVAEPGSRKSAVFGAMTDPLGDAEKQLVARGAAARWETDVALKVALQAAEKLQREAATAAAAKDKTADEKLADAMHARAAAEAITVPIDPRLLADDVTPEALVSLLADNGGRIAVLSAEAGIFDVLAGRYSKAPNLDPILKGHAGDRIRVDRKGRSSEYIDHPALTMCLTVQPRVIEEIGRNGVFVGRGLLARILFSIPPNRVGYRKVGAAPVPPAVAAEYAERIQALVAALHEWGEMPMLLQVSADAAEVFLNAERTLEPRLVGDLRPVQEWASKLMGATARIGGLLHLASFDTADAAMRRPISAETMTGALKIAAYYTDHAMVAFGLMGADRTLGAAQELLTHVHARTIEESSIRDLFTDLSRSRFPKTEDVLDALTVLVSHGWAAPLPPPKTSGPGRKPSPRYRFRPAPIT